MKTYKTIVTIEVTHTKPLRGLANTVAARAYTIDGVTNAEVVVAGPRYDEMREAGFTHAEIALGSGEVHRS